MTILRPPYLHNGIFYTGGVIIPFLNLFLNLSSGQTQIQIHIYIQIQNCLLVDQRAYVLPMYKITHNNTNTSTYTRTAIMIMIVMLTINATSVITTYVHNITQAQMSERSNYNMLT